MKKRLKRKKQQFIDSSVVYESIQIEALYGKLYNTLPFFERKVRRWFSEKFSTPLLDAYNLPWDFVLLHYYEDSVDSMDYNEVYDKVIQDYLPEFRKQAEEEDKEFADSLLAEQQETMRKKAARDEKYRKKLEEAGEIIDDLGKKADKLAKVRQSLKKKPEPKETNLSFDEDNPDSDE